MSTLARAIEDDDAKMIEKELEKNVNLVRICDERGLLPLFVAAGLNRVNALRVFLERGDPRATSASTGNHVLHFAVLNGHVDTCKIVLSKCPDLLDKPNRNGDTPLQTALVAGYWTVRQRVSFSSPYANLKYHCRSPNFSSTKTQVCYPRMHTT